jgi:3-dehydroquinate synthetase
LSSLDERHISNGISEIIKIAIVKNKALFDTLANCAQEAVKDRLVGRNDYDRIYDWAIEGMLEELRPNLLESDLQRCVDYGHTFSPAIEMTARRPLLHGEAVAIDMSISMALSLGRGLVNQEEYWRALHLMAVVGLPITHELARADFLWPALLETASHRDGRQRIPLSRGIGDVVFVNDITCDELNAATLRTHASAKKPEFRAARKIK